MHCCLGCCNSLPCVGWVGVGGGTNSSAPAWVQDTFDDHWVDRDFELLLDAMPRFLAFLRKEWQRESGEQGWWWAGVVNRVRVRVGQGQG